MLVCTEKEEKCTKASKHCLMTIFFTHTITTVLVAPATDSDTSLPPRSPMTLTASRSKHRPPTAEKSRMIPLQRPRLLAEPTLYDHFSAQIGQDLFFLS